MKLRNMRYEKKPLPGGSSGNSSMPRPATARPLRLLSLVLLGTLLALPPAAAQHRQVSVAFYNVENLFDTIASPLHADGDFTPSGRYGWDTERYRTKLDRIARTIDDAGFDVVALAEVESERAVRDLAETLHDDYSFIYRSTSDRRGISLALLYKGDKFFPGEISRIASGTSREFLYVQGELIGYPTGLLVCHLPSKFNDRKYRIRAAARLAEVADSLLVRAKCSRLLVLGDFNGELDEEPFRRAFGPPQRPVGACPQRFRLLLLGGGVAAVRQPAGIGSAGRGRRPAPAAGGHLRPRLPADRPRRRGFPPDATRLPLPHILRQPLPGRIQRPSAGICYFKQVIFADGLKIHYLRVLLDAPYPFRKRSETGNDRRHGRSLQVINR